MRNHCYWSIDCDEFEEFAIIDKLFVNKLERGAGIGRNLLLAALAEIKSHGLNRVRISAHPFDDKEMNQQDLIKFYSSLGFKQIKTPCEAVIMELIQ